MKKRWWIVSILILVVALALTFGLDVFGSNKQFTKTSLLRLNLPQGGSLISNIQISNYESSDVDFKVYLSNFDGLASLNESSFTLGPGEEKDVKIYFEDNLMKTDVFVGYFVIETSLSQERVPIILGIEDPKHVFAIIHSSVPKYDNVYPGGKLGIEVKIYDLAGSNVQTIPSKFVIKNFEDDVVYSSESNLVVGGGSKTELVDIENSWEKGDYVFITAIDYENTTSIASYLFSVSNKEDAFSFSNVKVLFISLMIFVLVILGMVFYFVKTRDELLLQLKKQQCSELKRNVYLVEKSKKDLKKSAISPKRKKEKIKALDNLKKNLVRKIKKKQKAQRLEVKKLKKKKGVKKTKKKDAIRKKMDSWKAQGYKMVGTEKEIRKISNGSIDKKLDEYKKQGYRVDFLK